MSIQRIIAIPAAPVDMAGVTALATPDDPIGDRLRMQMDKPCAGGDIRAMLESPATGIREDTHPAIISGWFDSMSSKAGR